MAKARFITNGCARLWATKRSSARCANTMPRFGDKLAGPGDLKAIVIAKSPAKRAQINALYTRWIDEAHGQEDIKGGMLGGMDLGELLGGALGGLMGGEE